MKVEPWCTSLIFLVTACATNLDTAHFRPVVSVIIPWRISGDISSNLPVDASQVVDLDEVTLNLFCVEDLEYVPRLVMALVERGDSVVVGVGRALLPAIADAAALNRGTTFLWLGWGSPPAGFPAKVRTWWADPDSLQGVVASLMVQQNSGGKVTIVGDALSHNVLSRLRNSGNVVEQRSVTESTFSGAMGEQPSLARAVLVLERPSFLLHGLADRIYWAAEGPPESCSACRAELHTDWSQALSDALKWHFGRGGSPPGGAADRWLTLKLRQDGGDSS